MIEIMSKNGASPIELLAFFCWAETYVPSLTIEGKGGSEMFHRLRSCIMPQIHNGVGQEHGLRYIWMEVADARDLDLIRRGFPDLLEVP